MSGSVPAPSQAEMAAPNLFSSLFSAYPDALLLVDFAGLIVQANPAAERLLGYEPGALLGEAVDALVPDSIRPRHAAYRDDYARNPRPRPMGTQMELVARRRDGSEVMVEIALSPLQDRGLPFVVAAIRDISAYPRMRQALQRARYAEQVAQLGRLAVDSRDPAALFRQASRAAAQALEVEQARLYLLEADGRSLRVAGAAGMLDHEHAETEGQVLPCLPGSPLAYLMAQQRPTVVPDYASEQRFEVPQAYLRAGLVSALGTPLLDQGRCIGALVVRSRQPQRFGDDELRFLESIGNLLSTILQRAQGEEALRHAQRLETVGQLTGGIAHDFNNLLTVIQGNLQVLEELPAVAGDAAAPPMVAAAMRATRRGAELTGKLLAFSRRQLLQPSRVEIAGLLASLAGMLRRTLDQRIHIEDDVAPDCPALLADAGQLESALLNIAINARDAMPEGGRLRFRAWRYDRLPPDLLTELPPSALPLLAIAVSDSGAGMPEAVRRRAFEPFFTTKEAGRGTGLGLSTVYGFVKQSQGAIRLDSSPGQGTTVTLYFPAAPQGAHRGQEQGEAGVHAPPPGLRVLLVEDEAEVRAVLLNFLQAWGCEIRVCSHAEAALAALAEPGADFDLLLTDVMLSSGLRGTELAAKVRHQHPAVAVLLMSGYAADLLTAELPVLRELPLLRKPFSREQLASAMAQALEA
ncbi:PAS domain S-box protein [Kinneretia asaccharophila]|uniref:histidine kinase n=1 Tax=Roseateles asaccharophilus TaxID=582607 RepID=A0A4R6N410_9BURK|nr:PAS domain S-box protein [Roseateles asaccharophilus]MDN3544599.1 PAS domain S-box protein [Roseateles asaccharophilus]TDP09635.1 PAS domain S-box-containing protein [Roseateles asaccharophilus]